MINHFYFYCVDADFGPFFLKFCSYFPYNAKLCLNGNEWAKRQAAKAGIGFAALDNGFAAVDDPAAVQAICDRLGPEQIDALLRKWLARSAAPVHRGRPGRRLPLRAVDPAGRVLADPDARRARCRVGSSSSRSSATTSTSAAPTRSRLIFDRQHASAATARHPGPVPDPGDHRRGHSESCTSTTSTPRIKQYHNCDARSHAMSDYVDWRVSRC